MTADEVRIAATWDDWLPPGFVFELAHYREPIPFYRSAGGELLGTQRPAMVTWICRITGTRQCGTCGHVSDSQPYCRGAGASPADAIEEARRMFEIWNPKKEAT